MNRTDVLTYIFWMWYYCFMWTCFLCKKQMRFCGNHYNWWSSTCFISECSAKLCFSSVEIQAGNTHCEKLEKKFLNNICFICYYIPSHTSFNQFPVLYLTVFSFRHVVLRIYFLGFSWLVLFTVQYASIKINGRV